MITPNPGAIVELTICQINRITLLDRPFDLSTSNFPHNSLEKKGGLVKDDIIFGDQAKVAEDDGGGLKIPN